MKSIKIIFFILLAISVYSCSDRGYYSTEFYYEETYCSDPWQQNTTWDNDNELKTLISSYLTDSLTIEFSNLRITEEGTPDTCSACTCKTGRYIRLNVYDVYATILTYRGGFQVD